MNLVLGLLLALVPASTLAVYRGRSKSPSQSVTADRGGPTAQPVLFMLALLLDHLFLPFTQRHFFDPYELIAC